MLQGAKNFDKDGLIIFVVVHEMRRQKQICIVDKRSFIIYPWSISIVK